NLRAGPILLERLALIRKRRQGGGTTAVVDPGLQQLRNPVEEVTVFLDLRRHQRSLGQTLEKPLRDRRCQAVALPRVDLETMRIEVERLPAPHRSRVMLVRI